MCGMLVFWRLPYIYGEWCENRYYMEEDKIEQRSSIGIEWFQMYMINFNLKFDACTLLIYLVERE